MRALVCTTIDEDVARLLNFNVNALTPTPMEKNMNLIEIIKILQKEGHKIEYSYRKDGGYIIRSIDGQRFSGKTGNAFARRLTGTPLSVARATQLARIRTPKGKKNVARTPIPDDLKRMMRKVQREWRKKHPTIEGTISTRGLRYQIEKYGVEEARMSLDKAYRYSMGYAYIDNVLFLIERINNDLSKMPDTSMEAVVSLIEQKQLNFREEWIAPIYNALYDWERNIISGQECARIIRSIII